MEPLTDVRAISRLAYGFMASKVLFAALNLDLFGRLAERPKTLGELTEETGIAANRLLTLLTACVSLGLLAERDGLYANAPASAAYLVRGAPGYFGDYYRFQIDRQIYPFLEQLDAVLRGEPVPPFYTDVSADETEAEHFSRAQHAGSLGPAHVLARQVDLGGCRRLLDVAGGSGAFSITLCRRYPALRATILDFPNMVAVAERYVREAGLEGRIDYLAGDALAVDWPADQQAIVLSYLLDAVGARQIEALLARAFAALEPGGYLLVHDFMVEDDRRGPDLAALWLVTAMGFGSQPDVVSLTPGWLGERARAHGFIDVEARPLIADITTLVTARKPSDR